MNHPIAIDSPLTPVPPHEPPRAPFPWWMGYLLASRLRHLRENPDKVLAPHVRAGMTVLDAGCAMGLFSLPMANWSDRPDV